MVEEGTSADRTTVLVVDDDPAVRESVAEHLEPLGYRVVTGADAAAGHGKLDADIDIALIERDLPDGSGDALLERIRSRNLGCRVALMTTVDPDFDILGIDCDDYLVKPLDGEALLETIDRLDLIDEYDEKRRQLSSLRVKRNVLEVEKEPGELRDSEEFRRLERRIESLESEIDDLKTEFDRQLGYDA